MNCILITGANRGIGLELSKQYCDENWHVIACSRHPEEAENALSSCLDSGKGKLTAIKADVRQTEDIQKIKASVKDFNIDILFNNAGVWGPKETAFGTVQAEPWLEVFKTNTIAPLLLAQELIQQIERSQLKMIVNMSSRMGSIEDNSTGDKYVYRSSKAALNAVTKSMAIDLKDKGITVISLHPGWVQTDMGGANAPTLPTDSVRGIRKVLSNITLQDTGNFMNYAGEKLPW